MLKSAYDLLQGVFDFHSHQSMQLLKDSMQTSGSPKLFSDLSLLWLSSNMNFK